MTSYRRLWLGVLALLVIVTTACSGSDSLGSINAPTQVTSASQTPSNSGGEPPAVTVPPTPPAPGASSTVPVFTMTGADRYNCVTATQGMNPLQWVLNMTDAGPKALRFVALSSQSPDTGCEATTRESRARIAIDGVFDYTPHSSGRTTFTFDPKLYNCGRVQVDVSIFDADGKEILIVGVVVKYANRCEAPPVVTPAPSCRVTLSPTSVQVGQNVFATLVITGNASSAKLNGNVVAIPSQGSPVVNITPTSVGTMRIPGEVTGPGGTATCFADLTVTPIPPAVCTATLSLSVDPLYPGGARYIAVTGASPMESGVRPVSVQFLVDGNPGLTMNGNLGGRLTVPYPEDNRVHRIKGTFNYFHSNGANCRVETEIEGPAVPPACTPSNGQITWGSYDNQSVRNLTANVRVRNTGSWTLELHRVLNGNDVTKNIDQVRLSCGEERTLSVSHDTDGSGSWYAVLKNGETEVTRSQAPGN